MNTGRTRVKRAYKYRFHPTERQREELLRTFGCVRKAYNLALDARARAWFTEQRRVNYAETPAMLTAWKRSEQLSCLSEVPCVPLQQALRHLQGAFTNFFGQRAKDPRFKSRKKSRQSAEYTKSAFTRRDGQLTLAKTRDPLNIVWSRPLPGGAEPSTVTVSRDAADRWFASSQTCSACGRLAASMPLHLRTWTCSGCATSHDRDVNAAANIVAAGLAVSARGAGVRPQREASRTGQSAKKQEPSGASRKEVSAPQGGE